MRRRAATGIEAGGERKRRAAAPDWRETLFVWRGALHVPAEGAAAAAEGAAAAAAEGAVHWRGTWVGTSTLEAPPSTAFVGGAACGFSATASADALPAALAMASSYELDGTTHADDAHSVLLPARGSDGVVAARGSNEFGEFIALGQLEGGVLTLARRYLSEDDARCSWGDAGAVLAQSGAATASAAAACTPWLLLPWKVAAAE